MGQRLSNTLTKILQEDTTVYGQFVFIDDSIFFTVREEFKLKSWIVELRVRDKLNPAISRVYDVIPLSRMYYMLEMGYDYRDFIILTNVKV